MTDATDDPGVVQLDSIETDAERLAAEALLVEDTAKPDDGEQPPQTKEPLDDDG